MKSRIPGLWLVDTNVLVAGLLSPDSISPPAGIVDAMILPRMQCTVSVELLAEYRSVLLRPRLQELHGLDATEIDRVLTAIVTHARVVDITEHHETAPDKGDNHLWQMLAASPEAGLITGDSLLLRNPPTGRRLYSAREWSDQFLQS